MASDHGSAADPHTSESSERQLERYVLDRDIVPYLVNRAADTVEERWRIRETAWRAGLTFLLLGLGWLGWNRIDDFQNELRADFKRFEDSAHRDIASLRDSVVRIQGDTRDRIDSSATSTKAALEAGLAKAQSDLDRRLLEGLRTETEVMSASIGTQARSVAETSVADLRQAMTSEIAAVQLSQFAKVLDEKPQRATEGERSTALALLTVCLKSKDVVERETFLETVEHLLDAFIESGYVADAKSVERAIGSLADRRYGIVATLLELYAREWLMTEFPTDAQEERFTHYLELASGTRVRPDLAVMAAGFGMLREFRRSGGRQTDTTLALLKEAAEDSKIRLGLGLLFQNASRKEGPVKTWFAKFRQSHEQELRLLFMRGEEEEEEEEEGDVEELLPSGRR